MGLEEHSFGLGPWNLGKPLQWDSSCSGFERLRMWLLFGLAWGWSLSRVLVASLATAHSAYILAGKLTWNRKGAPCR